MEMMMEETNLVRLCLEAACRGRDSVDKWRRQRRTLEHIPPHLADALIRLLLRRRLLFPSLLEVFKHSLEEIDLRGEKSVDAEWMAYLGAFRHLRSLNLADCHRITSSALWPITGMTCVKELNLSRCMKVTDAGIRHLLSISTLEKLWISETSVTADGVILLSSLTKLSVLDFGGLPVTDQALSSLQVLRKLQYLDLWGSKVSNKGAAGLQMFPKLSFLNLAWTNVTKLPNLSSLECLDMSNCTIDSILKGDNDKAPLSKLVTSGSTFVNEDEAFLYIDTTLLSYLDVSKSPLHEFGFINSMKSVQHLDLSFTMIGDDSVTLVADIGANLKYLNLANTRISSAGVGILARHVPNLEIISLSQTLIDDAATLYISMMSSLKQVDLSNTNIRGFIIPVGAEQDCVLSLTALQGLKSLERLNLEQTHIRDAALYPLSSSFQVLSHLSLKSAYLTDASLHHLSSPPNLTTLGIRDAVLTKYGLDSFKPPATLQMLDLSGCWVLTEDDILNFCKTYPKIEIRHEHSRKFPLEKFNRISPSQKISRTLQLDQKRGKVPMSPFFVDQRLKYSREELLALKYSSLSIASPFERGT